MYRDDLAAATARRDALGQELARLQSRLVDHETVQTQVRELTAELAEITKRIDQARRRVALPLLDRVTVSTPCKEPWARMQGDDQVRHCKRCDKSVYNLSAMTGEAAEALLGARGDLCVRFFRRPDGTVLTSDCPVGARRRRRRRLVVTAVAVAAGALGVAWMLQDRGEALGAGAAATSIRGDLLTAPEPMTERVGEMVQIDDRPMQGGISARHYEEIEGKLESP